MNNATTLKTAKYTLLVMPTLSPFHRDRRNVANPKSKGIRTKTSVTAISAPIGAPIEARIISKSVVTAVPTKSRPAKAPSHVKTVPRSDNLYILQMISAKPVIIVARA